MSSHDYVGCKDDACVLCKSWGHGYSIAYATSLFECAIAVCHMSATPECRCSPCVALKYAIFSMGEGSPGPSAPPPPTFGKCDGCGKDGMRIEVVPNKELCSQCWV